MKKILIVDDEPFIRQALNDSLTKAGYEIHAFENGFDVLKEIQSVSPELIISDISMPKLDGLEMVEALRNNEDSKSIPVIMLTASTGVDNFARGVNLGIKFFCPKPLDIKDIIEKVKSVIG